MPAGFAPESPVDMDETPIAINEADQGPDFQLMLTHIREMAGEVHSVGSPGLERAQGYLKNQLENMGYENQKLLDDIQEYFEIGKKTRNVKSSG
ncbi:MAG: hypothetical protein ACOX62_00900 [Christensenellales bacterium]|jgi:hypothetical protein